MGVRRVRTLSAVTCYRRKITPSICISTDKPFNLKMSIGSLKGQEEINRLLILFITELLLVRLIKAVGLINFSLGGSSQEEGAAWLSQPYGSCPFAWVRLFWAQRVGGLRLRRPCLQHTTLGVLSPLPAADPEPPGLVPPSYFREPSARADGSTGSPRKPHLSQCRGLLAPLLWAKLLWLQGCDRNQVRVSPRSSPQGRRACEGETESVFSTSRMESSVSFYYKQA